MLVARLAGALALALVGASAHSARAQVSRDAGDDAETRPPSDARALVAERSGASYARRAAITRELVAMDDRAVAALVVAKRGKSSEARAWAAETLESMGRERADEQIKTRNDEVLAGIFAAYGEARDPDALGVLSSFARSERGPLREAARGALQAYGGDAISTLRRGYLELTGEPASPAWGAEVTARALFDASDRIRLRDVYALLDEGLTSARSGDLAAAVRDFDAVLARHDEVGQRGQIARAYAAYASSIEDTGPAGARDYFERAARVAPTADAPRIAAELAVLDGRALEGRGLSGEASYRRALALDPTSSRARAAIERLESLAHARRERLQRWTLATVTSLTLLLALVLFVGTRRKKPPRRLTQTRSSRPSP